MSNLHAPELEIDTLEGLEGTFESLLSKYNEIWESITEEENHINRRKENRLKKHEDMLTHRIDLYIDAGYELTPEMKDWEPNKKHKFELEQKGLKKLYSNLHELQKTAVNFMGRAGESVKLKDIMNNISENHKNVPSNMMQSMDKLFKTSQHSREFLKSEIEHPSRGRWKLKRPLSEYISE